MHVEVLGKYRRLVRAGQAMLRNRPLSAGFFYSPRFAQAVEQALARRSYDVVFVYCSSMGQYLPASLQAAVIIDFVDADSAKWAQYARSSKFPQSWLFAREAKTVARFERSLMDRAAFSLTVTEHDAAELCGGQPVSGGVEVIPNGAEIPDVRSDQLVPEISALQPFVAFVGTMSYRPNADAAEYFASAIFPRLRLKHPCLRFVVVGREPGPAIRNLAKQPGIVVTGAVPDVYRYFRAASVSVAPFRISQGFHNKIAESLAVGTPVVASRRAAAGIGLAQREGLFCADTPEEFASMVDFLLKDARLQHTFRQSAEAVQNLLGWQTRLQPLDDLMMRATGACRPAEVVTGSYH